MKYGAKKGQSPKKQIKKKPVKAFTGLEIALIGGAAGLAGAALAGGGKKAEAMPLNNPAAMIAPLSGFVGSKEQEKKATGMKKGGLSGGKRSGLPPRSGPNSQGLKVKKAFMGLAVEALSNSQSARDFAGNFGLAGKAAKNYFNKEEKTEGMRDGGSVRGQKEIQVKKKVFRGVF